MCGNFSNTNPSKLWRYWNQNKRCGILNITIADDTSIYLDGSRESFDSDRCTFCKTEKETISHLLWDCTYTETFWKHVLEWITKNTPHVRSLNITEQLVIFGVKVDVPTDKVLDLIMLMAKYYIFRCRCLKTIPNFICFSKDVRQRAAIEKHAWALKGDLTAYFSLWSPYFPLIINNNV